MKSKTFFVVISSLVLFIVLTPITTFAHEKRLGSNYSRDSREVGNTRGHMISEVSRKKVCDFLRELNHNHLPPFCLVIEPPEPELTIDHLIITEVLYDLANDGSQGTETGAGNEWIEIYNPTNSPINLQNWSIADAVSSDVLSTESLILEPKAFAIITGKADTADYFDLQGILLVVLDSAIGSGLNNTGDKVVLLNAENQVIDQLSYGAETSIFSPSIASVAPGSSIVRLQLDEDTDSVADWGTAVSPTPGA